MSEQVTRKFLRFSKRVLRLGVVWAAGLVVLSVGSIASAELFGDEELRDPTRPASVRVAADGSFLFGLMDAFGGFGDGLRTGLDDLSAFGAGAIGEIVSSGYTVSFIRTGGERPVAMVNQQLVAPGDVIGEATVVSIDADGVTLLVNGQEQRVSNFIAPVKARVD
ncbi:MAG: hypothetical protein Q7V56_04760 [Gammaproteobacteria bacterium]|nr:hypothetical protein [Gammaproteobacteria bacterium]